MKCGIYFSFFQNKRKCENILWWSLLKFGVVLGQRNYPLLRCIYKACTKLNNSCLGEQRYNYFSLIKTMSKYHVCLHTQKQGFIMKTNRNRYLKLQLKTQKHWVFKFLCWKIEWNTSNNKTLNTLIANLSRKKKKSLIVMIKHL